MRLNITVMLGLAALTPGAQAASDALGSVLIREFRQASGVTGMAAAVLDTQGKLWHAQAGFADKDSQQPVTPQTAFRLASVSKFVTTVMLANMVERKQIVLARPVHAYLPDFPQKSHPFTVQQLATHTAGIPHYQMLLDAGIYDRATPFGSANEGTVLFRDRPLQHAPGTAYLYSSFGFNLLSAVMEKTAGQPFPLMVKELAQRANAPSLEVEHPAASRAHWSRLYDTDGDEVKRGDVTFGWAGGGLLANAGDAARVALLALDQSYLSRSTLTQFGTPARFNNGSVVKPDRFIMATGWRLGRDTQGRSYFHHSGAMNGARSHVAVYPGEGLAVALLSNTNFVSAMDSTGEALAEAVTQAGAAVPCRSGSKPFKGRYLEQDVEGRIGFAVRDGICTWTIDADNNFGARMLNGRKHKALGAYSRGGEGPVYLVTPIGIFPGKAGATTIEFTMMGRTATFAL